MPPKSKKSKAAEGESAAVDAAPVRRSTRARKSVVLDQVPEPTPTPKKGRVRRQSSNKEEPKDEDEFDPNEDSNESGEPVKATPKAPARGKGRAKAAAHKDTPAPKASGGRKGKRAASAEKEDKEEATKEKKAKSDDDAEEESESKKEVVAVPETIPEEEEGMEVDGETEDKKVEVSPANKVEDSPAKKVEDSPAKKVEDSPAKKLEDSPAKKEAKEEKKEEEPEKESPKKESPKKESSPAAEKKVEAVEKMVEEEEEEEEEEEDDLLVELGDEKKEVPVDAAKENGVGGKNGSAVQEEKPLEMPKGYIANGKFSGISKQLSVVTMLCAANKDDTVAAIKKFDDTDFICVQLCKGDIVKQAAEDCGYKCYHSDKSDLAILCKMEGMEPKGDVEYKKFSTTLVKEADNAEGEKEKSAVLKFITEKCNVGDEVQIAHFTCDGKPFTMVNFCVLTQDRSVQALEMGALIRPIGDKKAIILAGHMPDVSLASPTYQLLRDGYFDNDMIEVLQGMQDVKIEEKCKPLLNLIWKSFQHERPEMRSIFESVMGRDRMSSNCVWHTSTSVNVVALEVDGGVVKADVTLA